MSFFTTILYIKNLEILPKSVFSLSNDFQNVQMTTDLTIALTTDLTTDLTLLF